MTRLIRLRALAGLALLLTLSNCGASTRGAAWQPLLGAGPLTAWRGYRMDSLPSGWRVVDGALTRVAEAGDIVTRDEYGDFELELEWKIAPGGNSGIMYRVTESERETYQTGPEMQVLDDSGAAAFATWGSAPGALPRPRK